MAKEERSLFTTVLDDELQNTPHLTKKAFSLSNLFASSPTNPSPAPTLTASSQKPSSTHSGSSGGMVSPRGSSVRREKVGSTKSPPGRTKSPILSPSGSVNFRRYEILDNASPPDEEIGPPPPPNPTPGMPLPAPQPSPNIIVPLEEENIEDSNNEEMAQELRLKLMEAISNEEYDTVEELIKKRADVNYLDSFGKTPLISSLVIKNIQLTSLLLTAPHIDINQADANAQTPLIVVSKMPPTGSELDRTMINVLRKLILESEVVKINARDEGGNTALHYATANGDYSFAETLVSHNADVNILNSTGFNPIHLAASQDNVKLTLLYLKHGALLMIPTSEGKLPADLTNDFQLKLTLFGSRTSHSHPLNLKYIDLSFFAKKLGTLGICMCPGRKHKLWARDILLDLETLVKSNCNILVSVITRKELTEMGLNDFIECVKNIGLESYHISFANKWVPNSTDEFKQLTTIIVLRLLEGKNVVVHCDSGKGRSSLFVGSIFIQLGMPPEKAKLMLRGMSENYLNNPAQSVYLNGLKYKSLEISEKNTALTELETDDTISEKENKTNDG